MLILTGGVKADIRTRGAIYHTVPLADADTGERRDARPPWVAGTFPLFPVVRLTDGAPWAEANVRLIDMME